MSEFDGTPFVAGSAMAVRAFKVDSLGRLCSPQRDHIFTPDVNEAKCGATTADRFVVDYAAMMGTLGAFRGATRRVPMWSGLVDETSTGTASATAEQGRERTERETHKAGSIGCRCGYYAYYDESEKNAWLDPGCVEAVVEATGIVTHGTKGIRAEKVRVVGIVDPTAPSVQRLGERWDDFCARVEGKTPDLLGGLYLALAIMGTIAAVVFIVVEGMLGVGLAWLALAAASSFGAAVEVRGFTVNLNRHYPGLSRQGVSADRMARVRRNYPEVEVYPTREAMLAKHPTSKPPEPSPADADFWTRRT